MTSLAESVLEGNRLALARLLTQIENHTAEGRSALEYLFPFTGNAHLIGVTGAPGTGKSSLVNQLALYFSKSQDSHEDQSGKNAIHRIAIVAVDPSSPFTGGALLGDRVRMRDLSGNPNIFIRSMASRGSLGGLSRTTAGIVQVLDAAGYDVIMIETVGAGQAEVDIARLAHTTLVVEAPGMGDDIQTIKAGIMEIADVLVVNKADRPGVEATERALRNMLQLGHPTQRTFLHHGRYETVENADQGDDEELWIPPIQRTVALDGQGIPELVEMINRHVVYLKATNKWQEREYARLQAELDNLLSEVLISRWRSRISDSQYSQILNKVMARKMSPWQAVEVLLDGGEY